MKKLIFLLALSAFAQYPLQVTPYQIIDGRNGAAKACSGCFIYTYFAGTTTPQATYTSYTLGTPLPNPVRTNTAGYAVSGSNAITGIWTNINACYRIVFKDASAVTVWDQDNVCNPANVGANLQALLATSAGAGMIGFSQSSLYSAATVGKHLQQESINPMDSPYNAKCDGSTDDTTAIRNANSVAGSRRAILHFPSVGLCAIAGTITVSAVKTTWQGSGPASGLKALAATFNMVTVRGDDFRMMNMSCVGAATDATNNTECIFTAAANPALRGEVLGVTFDNVNNGIKLDTGNDSWDIHDNNFSHLWGTSAGHGYGVFTGHVKWVHVHHNRFKGEILTAGRHCVYFADATSFSEADNNSCIDFNSSNFPVFSAAGQDPSIGNRIHDNISSISVVPAPTPSILGGSVLEATGTVTDTVFANNTIISPIMPCGTAESENLNPIGGFANQGTQFINNTCSNFPGKGITLYGATNPVVDGNQLTNGSAGSLGVSAAIEISTSGNVMGHDMTIGARVTNNNIYGADLRSSLLIQNTTTLATDTYVNGNNFANGTNGTNGIENSGGAIIKSGINLIDGTTLVSSTIGTLELPAGWIIQGGTTTDCASLASDMCVFGSDTNNNAVVGISGKATTKNQLLKICNIDTGGDCFTLGENTLAKKFTIRGVTNSNLWHFNDITGDLEVPGGVLKVGGNAGLSVTKTVRASGGGSDCTLIFTGGILTGGSC